MKNQLPLSLLKPRGIGGFCYCLPEVWQILLEKVSVLLGQNSISSPLAKEE